MSKSGSALMASVVVAVVDLLIRSWLVMLLIGGLHSSVDEVPAIGYGSTVFLVALAGLCTSPRTSA
ncbi:hypothetical protein [Streptomyces sparsogenes]|uniref:hypothetical protein n=1 Tax=Streptomyces sparsogenes TaxID=67365 RepID=UPI0033C1694D